jgi:hypothetical protein
VSLDELLKRDCIIDTSLLSNFVFTGYAHLLQKLVNGPVLIPPAVLDPSETLLRSFTLLRQDASFSSRCMRFMVIQARLILRLHHLFSHSPLHRGVYGSHRAD